MPSGSTNHKLAFKGATIMGTLARYHAANLPELLEKINRNSIGLDDYLNRFWDGPTTDNYPPYNLVQINNVVLTIYSSVVLPFLPILYFCSRIQSPLSLYDNTLI